MKVRKYIEERPWGKFEQFTKNELTTVKIITVKPSEALSLQYHEKREEFWRVIKGKLTVVVGGREIEAKEGDEFWIPLKEKHQMKGGDREAQVLEISFGEFDENDIIRLSDKYGRV